MTKQILNTRLHPTGKFETLTKDKDGNLKSEYHDTALEAQAETELHHTLSYQRTQSTHELANPEPWLEKLDKIMNQMVKVAEDPNIDPKQLKHYESIGRVAASIAKSAKALMSLTYAKSVAAKGEKVKRELAGKSRQELEDKAKQIHARIIEHSVDK